MSRKYQITKNSNFWTSAGASPSSGTRLGAGVSLRLLPPLRRSRFSLSALVVLSALLGFSIFSDSAYATYSASISRTNSGTITLSDSSGGSIKPSSSGTLGTGSDIVTVSSNCSAGYNLYVSAISGGSTNLSLSGASTAELADASNYIPSTTTATGSEAALSKDTWGIGKDGVIFSMLPAYTADASSLTPLYTGTGSGDSSSASKNYTIYYGVNVSTAKTPGTYTGDVLYTVLMNGACLEYTLKFDSNGATSSELPDQTISFGQTVDLSKYSTMKKISKTGYHLSGWKIKDGDGTLLPTNNNTSLDDGESSELTLIAEWEANTYTITYNANAPEGTTVTGNTENQINQAYGSTTNLQANGFTIDGYEFKGWAYQSTATEKNFDESQANISVSALAENNASGSVVNTNGGTITLYAVWEKVTPYMQDVSASDLTESATTTLRDSRDNQDYTVYRWPSSGTADTDYPTGMAGYAIMTKDLALGYVTGGSVTAGSNLSLTTAASNFDSNTAESTGPDKETVTYDSTETVKYVNSANGGTGWTTTNSYTNKQYTNGPKSGSEAYSSHSYYSWGAAMVVCPKGWRLPTNTEYNSIRDFMGGDNSTGSSKIRGAPYNFAYGDSFYSSGWYDIGSFGYYWSSTQLDSTYGRYLFFASSNLYIGSYGKKYGASVRCVSEYVPDCSETVHPTTTTGCKMKDDNIWIYGNNGNTTTWSASYTCPTGYSSPSKDTFDSLVSAQGSGNQLYSALGLSGLRGFWSTTQNNSSYAYYLRVDSSSASVGGSYKYGSAYVLCYKSASRPKGS